MMSKAERKAGQGGGRQERFACFDASEGLHLHSVPSPASVPDNSARAQFVSNNYSGSALPAHTEAVISLLW